MLKKLWIVRIDYPGNPQQVSAHQTMEKALKHAIMVAFSSEEGTSVGIYYGTELYFGIYNNLGTNDLRVVDLRP